MTTTLDADARIPVEVAKAAILPESYKDEEGITYPAFSWLRRHNPFGIATIDGYDPIWLATTHADILAIERNPNVFASGLGEPFISDRASLQYLTEANAGRRTQDTLAYMDAPEHTRIKAVTSDWFLPANVRKREDAIRALARTAVADLLDRRGELDFVKDFSLYFPLRVIMSLFGVPPEDEPRMLRLTQDLFGNADPDERREDIPDSPDVAARMWKATLEDFFGYFNALAADRRRNPTDDLASIIANAKIDGEYLPDSFIHGYYIAIATAGHDTTASTISGAIHAFARDPEQLRLVREDPSLIPSLVDEALRWVSPVKHFHRIVAEDTEFRGRRLSRGDSVMLLYPSANRDETVFDRPDTFDLTRRPNKHIAFGYGPHMCIGQHVAKFEMRILFEELLPHLQAVEVTGTPRYVAGNFLSGLKTLPVRLTTV